MRFHTTSSLVDLGPSFFFSLQDRSYASLSLFSRLIGCVSCLVPLGQALGSSKSCSGGGAKKKSDLVLISASSASVMVSLQVLSIVRLAYPRGRRGTGFSLRRTISDRFSLVFIFRTFLSLFSFSPERGRIRIVASQGSPLKNPLSTCRTSLKARRSRSVPGQTVRGGESIRLLLALPKSSASPASLPTLPSLPLW